jgi:CRP/FNR family cyclic AMP-dependent transcriptional regulator
MELVKLLKGVELFAGLTDSQFSRLAAISHPLEFRDGQVVIAKGEPGDSLYIICEGQVGVIISDEPDIDRSTVFLGQGQIFGEMALIDYGERSATIRCASKKALIYVIGREDFERLCQSDTAIGYVVMRNLASDLSFKMRHRNMKPKSN